MCQETPLLTIAVPTYNGSGTIRAMMDLLLPQVTDRVELIVVDNCSTDETQGILKEYQARYPFIRIERNQENIGADGNFLKAMRLAKGKYIYLLSDDDVLMEGSLKRILRFLEANPDMGLIYLETANFHSAYQGRERCYNPNTPMEGDVFTRDKKVFFPLARFFWGFLSSFIISRERFEKIQRPEQYFGTYWLQAYIHILCASGESTGLGAVGGLCVGAGVYITQSNFDTAFVDGVSYKKMLDFAVERGFDRKQAEAWYIQRICILASHGLVKEKATGSRKINKRLLFSCTWRYPRAWIKIYPYLFVPKWVCRKYMAWYRRKKNASGDANLNRAGDVATKQ